MHKKIVIVAMGICTSMFNATYCADNYSYTRLDEKQSTLAVGKKTDSSLLMAIITPKSSAPFTPNTVTEPDHKEHVAAQQACVPIAAPNLQRITALLYNQDPINYTAFDFRNGIKAKTYTFMGSGNNQPTQFSIKIAEQHNGPQKPTTYHVYGLNTDHDITWQNAYAPDLYCQAEKLYAQQAYSATQPALTTEQAQAEKDAALKLSNANPLIRPRRTSEDDGEHWNSDDAAKAAKSCCIL